MRPRPERASELAHRLWARSAGKGTTVDIGPAAERLCADLRFRLTAWVGVEGYRVLLDRAIARGRNAHPVLDQLSCLQLESGTASTAIATHGQDMVAAALTALMAELIESLERIVGTDLARSLVEQAVLPAARHPVQGLNRRGSHG